MGFSACVILFRHDHFDVITYEKSALYNTGDCLQLFFERLDLNFGGLLVFLFLFVERKRLLVPGGDIGVFDEGRALKDPGQGVVVGGRDGVELVIVTAGTPDCHAEE